MYGGGGGGCGGGGDGDGDGISCKDVSDHEFNYSFSDRDDHTMTYSSTQQPAYYSLDVNESIDTSVSTERNVVIKKGGDMVGDFSHPFVQLERCNERMEWPPSTSIYCYNCCHSFTTRPWFLPVEYHAGIFIVKYNFCSPGCVMRFNHDYKEHGYGKRLSLFSLMYQRIYNTDTIGEMALPKNTLSVFGGNMSIELYREYTNPLSKPSHDIKVEYPQIYSILPTIEMKRRSEIVPKSTKYTLYREKPLLRSQTSILSSISSKGK
jgi:hypothetical protein